MRAGGKKYFRYSLDDQRLGKRVPASGKFLRVVDASGSSARIQISVGENTPDHFETLPLDGYIYDKQGFSEFFVKNDAQSGEWVKIMVSEGPEDYDVKNPSQGVISSVGSIDSEVEIVNGSGDVLDVDDANTQGKLDDILALLQNADDLRAPLTDLSNATYAEVRGATTPIVTAGSNPNGVIIRYYGWVYNNAQYGALVVDGNLLLPIAQTTVFEVAGVERNIKLPAGVDVDLVSTETSRGANVWYEVL